MRYYVLGNKLMTCLSEQGILETFVGLGLAVGPAVGGLLYDVSLSVAV
jgi:hypothetical protein